MERLSYALDCLIAEYEAARNPWQWRRLRKAIRAVEDAAELPRRRWWRR